MFIVEEHTVRTGREHLNIAIVFVFSNKNNVVTVTAGKGIIIIPLCFTKCIDRYWHWRMASRIQFIPCEGSTRHSKCLIIGTRNSGLLKLLMMEKTPTTLMIPLPVAIVPMMSWRWRMSLQKQLRQRLSPSQEDFTVQKRQGYLTARTFTWWGEFYHQLRWGEALAELGSVGVTCFCTCAKSAFF